MISKYNHNFFVVILLSQDICTKSLVISGVDYVDRILFAPGYLRITKQFLFRKYATRIEDVEDISTHETIVYKGFYNNNICKSDTYVL